MGSEQLFVIDKILKTCNGTHGKLNYYISWVGYLSKFDSWVHEIIN